MNRIEKNGTGIQPDTKSHWAAQVISDWYWIVPWGGKVRAAETKVFSLARFFKREESADWIGLNGSFAGVRPCLTRF